MSDRWFEPPLAGTEVEHLLGSLDRLRATFRWKADGLDAAGLAVRVGASSLTIGGLLKHMARVEAHMWGPKRAGTPIRAPWDAVDWDSDSEWDFESAASDSPEDLYALYDGTVAWARSVLADAVAAGGLGQRVAIGQDRGLEVSLRRLVCDMVEEYGRHTGHADLLREAVDGRVGEDPPSDWRPSPGW